MDTAKEIADAYFPSDDMSASNLELDILRYLEFHIKAERQRLINPETCNHVFFYDTNSGMQTIRETCAKCGVSQYIPTNRPFSSQKAE